jgi:uncharacterized protein YcbK (DUF882 family)
VTPLSEHFSLEEFHCSSGEPVPPDLMPNLRHLVTSVLEPLRARWGILIIVSGYRSPVYNEALRKVSDERARRAGLPHGGVAQFSQHLTASAADVRPVRIQDVPALCSMVEEMLVAGALPSLGGFGRYGQWIHLDVRPRVSGQVVRWLGQGVGSEP